MNARSTPIFDAKLAIEYLPVASITADPKNARKHSAKQVEKLARIIDDVGWSAPIVIFQDGMVGAGHARLAAAKLLGMTEVPCVRITKELTPAQRKALAIADNAMTDASNFDDKILRDVLMELNDLDFDLTLTGLEMGVIDFLIDGPATDAPMDPADTFAMPVRDDQAIAKLGDLWLMEPHKLLCGDALEISSYERLLEGSQAAMVFSDPPYNVPVNGHVSGLGRNHHPEFAMASGEMSNEEFRTFLSTFMRHLTAFSRDGSIHYLCIDWRHLRTMLEASDGIYSELKNIVVWNKTNAGMGSLYRSKHELIPVFKNGKAPHTNHVALGKNGRHRSNVWDYAGANAFGATRDADLAGHPTPKSLQLLADAMRDCSDRGDLILDPFMGSGVSILAAERSKRRAVGIEIDPHYVDLAVRRWQKATGKSATLASDGRTFAEIAAERLASPSSNGEDA